MTAAGAATSVCGLVRFVSVWQWKSMQMGAEAAVFFVVLYSVDFHGHLLVRLPSGMIFFRQVILLFQIVDSIVLKT